GSPARESKMNLHRSTADLFPVATVDWGQIVREYRAAVQKSPKHHYYPVSRVAEAARFMKVNQRMTPVEIGAAFGRAYPWVTMVLRFHNLHKEAQDFFNPSVPVEARLGIEDVRLLLQAPKDKQGERAANLSRAQARRRKK